MFLSSFGINPAASSSFAKFLFLLFWAFFEVLQAGFVGKVEPQLVLLAQTNCLTQAICLQLSENKEIWRLETKKDAFGNAWRRLLFASANNKKFASGWRIFNKDEVLLKTFNGAKCSLAPPVKHDAPAKLATEENKDKPQSDDNLQVNNNPQGVWLRVTNYLCSKFAWVKPYFKTFAGTMLGIGLFRNFGFGGIHFASSLAVCYGIKMVIDTNQRVQAHLDKEDDCFTEVKKLFTLSFEQDKRHAEERDAQDKRHAEDRAADRAERMKLMKQLAEKDQMIMEKDRLLAERYDLLAEQHKIIAGQSEIISWQFQRLTEKYKKMEDLQLEVFGYHCQLAQKYREITKMREFCMEAWRDAFYATQNNKQPIVEI